MPEVTVSVNHAKVVPVSIAKQRIKEITLPNNAFLVVLLCFMFVLASSLNFGIQEIMMVISLPSRRGTPSACGFYDTCPGRQVLFINIIHSDFEIVQRILVVLHFFCIFFLTFSESANKIFCRNRQVLLFRQEILKPVLVGCGLFARV